MNHAKDTIELPEPLAKIQPWWQSQAFTIGVAILGLVIVIVMMTVNITKYETHLATGDTVLLELAPIDPRGFMQGDYMTLNYAVADKVLETLDEQSDEEYPSDAAEGYLIVTIDDNQVGQFSRLANGTQPDTLATNEMAIFYRIRNGSLKLATNAYFFQEGQAKSFEAAEYGLFRVNKKGEPLLTDMVDANFAVIKGVNNVNSDNGVSGDNATGLENMGRTGDGT